MLVNVQRQPGANVIEVVDRIKALLPQLTRQPAVDARRRRPQRPHRHHPRLGAATSSTSWCFAVALVVAGHFLFLRNVAATIIPSVAVPLSLVGTFGVMYLAGFSINNLTLMALTIATGFVVDDAIVMVENIARYIEEGATPMEAALKGAQQIGFTLVSLTDLADRGADPAAVHGRRRRPAVPRVRDHAGGVDPDLAGRVADADADDVRAPAQAPSTREEQGRLLPRAPARVLRRHRSRGTAALLAWCCATSR